MAGGRGGDSLPKMGVLQGRYPQPGQDGGLPQGRYSTLVRSGWGEYPKVGTPPWSGEDGGESTPRLVLPPPSSRTCYTAGGMPLAFTQEDFLVE